MSDVEFLFFVRARVSFKLKILENTDRCDWREDDKEVEDEEAKQKDKAMMIRVRETRTDFWCTLPAQIFA